MYIENLTTVQQLVDTVPDKPNLEIIASRMNNKLKLEIRASGKVVSERLSTFIMNLGK